MTALRQGCALVAAGLLVLLTTGAGTPGPAPGTMRGAELVKTGWWWAGNESPLEGTPLAPPQSAPPNVPKGALPVAAAGGEPEKVSALEFAPAAGPGDLVTSARLTLRESTEPGATVNPANAAVVACPVTEAFWSDGAAGAWKARPTYDCDLAKAPGTRDAKGVWTFDLTTIASQWTVEGGTGSPSIVLVEGADEPLSFQVAFDGPEARGIGFELVFTKAPPTSDVGGASVGGAAGPVAPGGSSGSGSGVLGAVAGAAGSIAGAVPAGSALPVAAPAPAAAESAPAVAAPATAQTTPVSSAPAAPAWYSGIPTGGLLLVPFALGLAYLAMLALGPDAQPSGAGGQRGVARALERLQAAGTALTTRRQA